MYTVKFPDNALDETIYMGCGKTFVVKNYHFIRVDVANDELNGRKLKDIFSYQTVLTGPPRSFYIYSQSTQIKLPIQYVNKDPRLSVVDDFSFGHWAFAWGAKKEQGEGACKIKRATNGIAR